MNHTEAAMLCRYVKACCPQQKFDEFTPDAWAELLNDIPFGIAKKAATEVAKIQPFVSPSEIRGAVRKIRTTVANVVRGELEKAEQPPPEIEGYVAWSRGIRARANEIADQRIEAGVYELAPALEEPLSEWSPSPQLRKVAASLSIERA